MNVMYVRTFGNQPPSKAHIRETLLQNTAGRADSNNTFSYEGARKYLPHLVSRGSSPKFSPWKRSWNRIIITFREFTLLTRGFV